MYEFQVEGMSCNHCVGHVTRAVKSLDATAAVEIDLTTQKVTVESTAPRASLAAAIADAGYPVKAGANGT